MRETIAHLPPEQRERIAGLARHVPAGIRFGPVFGQTQREIRKARTVPSWGREERDRRLRSLLDAAAGTDYYGSEPGYEALRDRGLSPMQRLQRLPILSRQTLSEHSDRMLTVDERHVERISTSGTSGEPIVFWLDRARGASEWAYVLDAWNRATGYQPDDWRLRLRGAQLPGGADWFVQSSTGEVVLRVQALAPELVEEHWGMASERGIRYLHGLPSALSYLARLLESELPEDPWRHSIRGIFTVSEELTQTQLQTLQAVFPQAKVANFYGLSERTAFAVMDDEGRFHPEPLYGVTELLDEQGRAVDVGARGRIITTGLRLAGQPFLRYDTGDSALRVGTDRWGQPIFREIRSRRSREGLVCADGSVLLLAGVALHSREALAARKFCFRQTTRGHAVLVVEPSSGATSAHVQDLHKAMAAVIGDRIDLELEVVDRLEIPANGKERLIDQQIPGAVATWA